MSKPPHASMLAYDCQLCPLPSLVVQFHAFGSSMVCVIDSVMMAGHFLPHSCACSPS